MIKQVYLFRRLQTWKNVNVADAKRLANVNAAMVSTG